MTRDFTEPCLCIAEHTFISISDRLFIWVITRFFRFSYGSLQEMYIIVFQVSGTMFVFPVFKMLPSYPDRFPARDDVFPDTFKCSVIKQISRIFIFFWRWSWKVPPPLPLPTLSLSHRDHHYQPPLSPPPLSQPPRSQPPPLTKTCFARLRNAVFQASTFSTFSF